MSRCVLDDEKRGTEVVVGWDPPIGTFFAHVRERAPHDGEATLEVEDHDVRIWTGCGDRAWTTTDDLDELIALIQPYACPYDQADLRKELLTDQANNDGERTYDLYDGSDGWPGDELPEGWTPQVVEPKFQ